MFERALKHESPKFDLSSVPTKAHAVPTKAHAVHTSFGRPNIL